MRLSVACVLTVVAVLGFARDPVASAVSVGRPSTPVSAAAQAARRCHKHCRPKHPARGDKPPATVDATKDSTVAVTSPPAGNDPDLRDPWAVGVSLVAGGDCGYYAGEGDHQDYGGRWQADSQAIDFGVCGSADNGIPVLAATAGVVRVAGHNSFYGYTVVIERNRGGLATRYAGLGSKLRVRVGQHVRAGHVIGRIGYSESGQTVDDAHLHFAVYSSPHRARNILRLGRQTVANDSILTSMNFKPGPLPPSKPPYDCRQTADPMFNPPLARQLNRGDLSPAVPFTATGREIRTGSAYLTQPDGSQPQRRMVVAISTRPAIAQGSLLSVAFANTTDPPNGSELDAQFQFNPPALTRPGQQLYLIFGALDDALDYFRANDFSSNPDAAEGCVIATLKGTK